eukprot:scaffold2639_cov361-Pavlova_lutheri.AAC.14
MDAHQPVARALNEMHRTRSGQEENAVPLWRSGKLLSCHERAGSDSGLITVQDLHYAATVQVESPSLSRVVRLPPSILASVVVDLAP